ncbi:MAG: enoyl-CoA hydratase/isomerase family protein, partial [Alphaproteobacteria bacterium]
MSDPVLLRKEGAVAVITLNRPEVLNALSMEMSEMLCDICWQVEADTTVRSVLVHGAGKGFQAGGDIASFHKEMDRIGEHAGRMIDTYHVAV